MNEEQNFQQIVKIVADRLAELGLSDQQPTTGIVRVVHDAVLQYYSELEDEEMSDGEHVIPIPGLGELRVSLAMPSGADAMIVSGHRIEIADDGEIEAYHLDGSKCTVGCTGCDGEHIYVKELDGEYYAVCGKCKARTPMVDRIPEAIMAWVKDERA